MRTVLLAWALSVAPAVAEAPVPASWTEAAVAGEEGFGPWIAGFRARALAAGIAPEVFDSAMAGVEYLPDVVRRDRTQSEFTKPIWTYLDSAVSADRVAGGRKALARHAALFDRIEAAYGVEKEVVAAIWGLESAYGSFRGTTPVIPALATLAHDGRRSALFEAQLLDALRIVQTGEAAPEALVGSWAGAMGHTQFMPSSWARLAVDFDGDGRRDIWGDDPADALASAAAYLAHHGWRKGMPWGVEVALPAGFDHALAGETRPVADWRAMGLRRAGGGDLPDHGPAEVLLPAGHRGTAFLIFANFRVIERYNSADAYVIAVGHLADRLRGGQAIKGPWPRGDRALSRDERREVQQLLTAAGFDTGGVDGLIGPRTIRAVRAFQASRGLVPDGYVSDEILGRLR